MDGDTNPNAVPKDFEGIFEQGLRGLTAAANVKVKRDKSGKSCDKAAEVRTEVCRMNMVTAI